MSMQANRKPGQKVLLQPKYNDGRTKQSFKDETDINKILQRAQKTGTISHLNKYEGTYGDFSNFDFVQNQIMLTRGRQIFDDLPAEIRSEFNQSQAQFFAYVNDPANKDRLGELLPELAAPGRQNLDMRGNIPADETKALEEREKPLGDTPRGESSEDAPPAHKEPLATAPAEKTAE